jgi:hypothetical protein
MNVLLVGPPDVHPYLFGYFPSKEDVFFTGTRECLDLVWQAFAAHAGALPTLTAMRATLDQIIETPVTCSHRIAMSGCAC